MQESAASEPTVAQEGDSVDSKSPDANGEELTPQPSRHASTSSQKETLDLPEMPRSATPPMSQHRPSSMSSNAPLSPGIQRTISETIDNHINGEDSPVMNETLSVIDEHITDLSTPRHSMAAKEQPAPAMDSESDYSSHTDNRLSYIHGHETDEEEEENTITEEFVKSWDHLQTAQCLRQLGVEPRHCDIFQEQEITGDVLIDMDQSFIYMKEFDFGVMGKRMKTWHKIKAFQEEVKGVDHHRQSSSAYSGQGSTPEEYDRSQSRNGMTSPFLPRIPSLTGPRGSNYRQSRESGASSRQQMYTKRNGMNPTSNRNNIPSFSTISSSQHDSQSRPSAASVRDINHSRRHSSIDASPRSPTDSLKAKNSQSRPSHIAHQHKNSLDKGWTMPGGTQTVNDGHRTSLGANGSSNRRDIFGKANGNGSDSAITFVESPDDLDRGYFSGGELEVRKSRNVLKKRDSASGAFTHSAQSSIVDGRGKNSSLKRHSRYGSADSIRDIVPQGSAASKAYNSTSLKTRIRSASARSPESPNSQSHSPTVTNLEQNPTSAPGFFSSFSPLTSRPDGVNGGRSTPLPSAKNVTPKVRRALGLRAISDAVTGNERDATTSPVPASPLKESPQSPANTGSSAASAASKSFGRNSTEGSLKTGGETTTTIFSNRGKFPVKPGVKSKKETSAYMRGLEKKTPKEQMADCDYSGWMKKKSSNLMTTWKPRLFVLRGRRLSYYYSENDTEERGLIDISSHRVLRADQDPLTAIHATITGAKASVTSPTGTTHSPAASTDADSNNSHLARPKTSSGESPFIFKLVPPKTGLSRAVQFTKPSVHFFQVDNVKQGRLWMAALMKATIDRDPNLPVEMTNRQKTVSLKQARAMNQRPPALMALEDQESEPKPEDDLNLHAIIFDDPATGNENDKEWVSVRPGSLG